MSDLSLTWHGQSTFTLKSGDTHIVIDPFFAPNNPVADITADEAKANYILVTHGHGDHFYDCVPLAKRTNAKVIANFEICEWLNKNGVDHTHPQHIGGGFQHEFGHVKFTPAFHGSAMPDGSYGGMPTGIIVTIGEKKLYFAGDTGLFSDMTLIGAHGLDIAILPIGDNFTMGPDDALLALGFLKPKAVIPCHYNTWPLIAQDADAWGARVAAEYPDTKPMVLEVGKSIEL